MAAEAEYQPTLPAKSELAFPNILIHPAEFFRTGSIQVMEQTEKKFWIPSFHNEAPKINQKFVSCRTSISKQYEQLTGRKILSKKNQQKLTL